MNTLISRQEEKVLKSISTDRIRTNLLKTPEQKTLAFLVQRIPDWVSSDMLTFIGFLGSLTIMLSFILAAYIDRSFLLLGILGFIISWFGDSLDGRIAFYRRKPRKWYGFALDITIDWISIILIGWGYVIYSEGSWEVPGFGFVVLYGWAVINTLMKYKITGEYTIDPGLLGPTEARIILSGVLLSEVFIDNSMVYSISLLCLVLLIVNLIDTLKLLRLANDKDRKEKEEINEKEKTAVEAGVQ